MNKSISEIIMERRSINDFVPDSAPPRDIIIKALEHAAYAPNHYMTQPWHFYLLGSNAVSQLCELNAKIVAEKKGEKAAEIIFKRWKKIPGWLVMTSPLHPDDWYRDIEDYAACCCAAQNMMLYLWNEGIGMKWTTGAVTKVKEYLRIIGADPEKERNVGMFWYGVAAGVPVTTRNDINDSITDVS
jgi:nitroreductase